MAARRRRKKSRVGTLELHVTMDPDPARIGKIYDLLADDLQDYRPAWKVLVPDLKRGIQRNFKGPWGPNDPTYAARKAREGFGDAVLILTETLFREATRDTPIVEGPMHMRYGVRDLPYARSQQFQARKTAIFGRFFMAWNRAMIRAADNALNDHARRLLARTVDRIEQARGKDLE